MTLLSTFGVFHKLITAYVTLTGNCSDIDHLTRILVLCGTPEQDTIEKITSEEVLYYIFEKKAVGFCK